MNKLSALSKLASAYHHLKALPEDQWLTSDFDAMVMLVTKFGYIRRSLRVEDLKPQPRCTEGYSPRGPQHF